MFFTRHGRPWSNPTTLAVKTNTLHSKCNGDLMLYNFHPNNDVYKDVVTSVALKFELTTGHKPGKTRLLQRTIGIWNWPIEAAYKPLCFLNCICVSGVCIVNSKQTISSNYTNTQWHLVNLCHRVGWTRMECLSAVNEHQIEPLLLHRMR